MKVGEMMDIFIDRQLQMKELEVLVNLTSNKYKEQLMSLHHLTSCNSKE